MEKIEMPVQPLWPLVFTICDTAKRNGVIIGYEVAEKCFLSLIEAAKKETRGEVQFGGLEYTSHDDIEPPTVA